MDMPSSEAAFEIKVVLTTKNINKDFLKKKYYYGLAQSATCSVRLS